MDSVKTSMSITIPVIVYPHFFVNTINSYPPRYPRTSKPILHDELLANNSCIAATFLSAPDGSMRHQALLLLLLQSSLL
ncbi:Protein of unknown function [Pyronema omphalodes CBS 100304]|uniref:Uncharacterized protein n=1 Tax=Pyronema omphalodes (strain CBS 100304) TaxID=1076935 RepID=U4L9Y0_PYROM|nr:Protein of unknown function [Pyronema omphalodes CBS 100304]